MKICEMLLWRNSEKPEISFDEVAERAYSTMELFNALLPKYRPNFLTVWRKKDAKKLNWNYSDFKHILSRHVNREGQTIFPELGYQISFFSDLSEEDMFGYEMCVGNTCEMFNNNLIVHFAPSFSMSDPLNLQLTEDLFRRAVQTFQPYWGCVTNWQGEYFDNRRGAPAMVHWLNYFSDETVHKIGSKKINSMQRKYPEVRFDNGFLRIKDSMLDSDDKNDLAYQTSIAKHIGFCR